MSTETGKSNLPMAQTGYEEEARLCAQATLLPGSESGGYGQNDVASPVFLAWSKQDRAGRCLEMALATSLCRSPCALSTSPTGPFRRDWPDSRPQSGRSSPTLRGTRRSAPWWPRLPRPCAAISIRRDAIEAGTEAVTVVRGENSTSRTRIGSRASILALRRLRSQRRTGCCDVNSHRHRQAQRCRPAGLARRRARPLRQPVADPSARPSAPAMEDLPPGGSGRI